jgi:hypothetical protein
MQDMEGLIKYKVRDNNDNNKRYVSRVFCGMQYDSAMPHQTVKHIYGEHDGVLLYSQHIYGRIEGSARSIGNEIGC